MTSMSIPPSTSGSHNPPANSASDRSATHVPVMVQEVIDALRPRVDGIYVDCTFGRGGHARALLARLGPDARLFAIDRDPQAIAEGEALARRDSRVTMRRLAFSSVGDAIREQGMLGRVSGVMMDLGVSSPMLDDPSRGFSFRTDGPLDMRMDPDVHPNAAEWIAQAGEAEMVRVIKLYGEERRAKRIAARIVAARADAPIATTSQLARLVVQAVGWSGDKHPATRTFQAIRIAINAEMEELERALPQTPDMLEPGGRVAVLSFHSLEDRIVKRFISGDRAREGRAIPRDLPLTAAQLAVVSRAQSPVRLRAVGKAVRPGAQECARNPRSRSATLRVAEKVEPGQVN